MAASRARPRLRSIRIRATIAATLVVALALLLAGWGVVAVLRHQLVADLDASIRARARDVTLIARGGQLPSVLLAADDDSTAVQVTDASGRVIASSRYLPPQRRLAGFRPAPGGSVVHTVEHPPVGDGAPFRVVAVRPSDAGGITVYAAGSLQGANQSVATTRFALGVAIPFLTLVVAGLTYLVVGRALRPVEHVRREVAEITGSSLDRRIPDPGSGDEISRLADTMNAMLDRLDAAARRQEEFVVDASHELRSPLASIQTQLDVALGHSTSSEWPDVARNILDENHRLQLIVDDLLALAGASNNGQTATRVPVDLDELVLRETESLRAASPLKVDISGVEGGRVLGDPRQLTRLVRNLVDNAARHARQRIGVAVRQVDENVELVVDDDGPGIPPADRERVFERFTRLDEARNRDEGGTGLGLAIARAVAVTHGGTIMVADSNSGARVVTRIPTAPTPRAGAPSA